MPGNTYKLTAATTVVEVNGKSRDFGGPEAWHGQSISSFGTADGIDSHRIIWFTGIERINLRQRLLERNKS